MHLRRRLPGVLLLVAALALTAVIASRVSAGADPAPRDTSPIVITPSTPDTPSADPTVVPPDDNKVVPRLRDDDDDDGPDDDDDDHDEPDDDD